MGQGLGRLTLAVLSLARTMSLGHFWSSIELCSVLHLMEIRSGAWDVFFDREAAVR